MDQTTPLPLRCLALTGTFETGKLPPECFGVVAGDFDGQGLSFSALQWNLGQSTLQPMLRKMFLDHATVMQACFGGLAISLQSMLAMERPGQLAWARSVVNDLHHRVAPVWVAAFAKLGLTSAWQTIAVNAAYKYFDQAKFQAAQLKVKSDRAHALLFDIAVQCGGVSSLAMHHVLDQVEAAAQASATSGSPGWGEIEILRAVANAVADGVKPQWRRDVLDRKLTVANGSGEVHGAQYDLAKQFGL